MSDNGESEDTVKNLLRMKPKPHKVGGEGGSGERDKPARRDDEKPSE